MEAGTACAGTGPGTAATSRRAPRTGSAVCCFAAGLILFQVPGFTQQPQALELSGDFRGTHDPSIIKQGDTWYVFATGKAPGGGQIPIRCSQDLKDWHFCGQAFDSIPDWIRKESPATRTLWAPDISYYRGEYRLYYAYSLFGKNSSGIALATNRTLDSKSPDYKWVDKGPVLRSTASDDYNAIDPNFVVDKQGRSWLDFGSLWSGIKLRRLNDEGMPSTKDGKLYSLAARQPPSKAIEAPFVMRHGKYYYLFVSWDLCCKGARSTYRIMAGRASRITGPYVDEEGKPMLEGGGTEILEGNHKWVGPGGESILPGSPRDLIAFHAYDAKTGQPALQISTIDWSGGWPHIALVAYRDEFVSKRKPLAGARGSVPILRSHQRFQRDTSLGAHGN